MTQNSTTIPLNFFHNVRREVLGNKIYGTKDLFNENLVRIKRKFEAFF